MRAYRYNDIFYNIIIDYDNYYSMLLLLVLLIYKYTYIYILIL